LTARRARNLTSSAAVESPSLLRQAKLGNSEAVRELFGHFLPRGEEAERVGYFGSLGLFGLSVHYFSALSDKRLATIEIGVLDGITYAEAPIAAIIGSDVFLYSRLRRYVFYLSEVLILLLAGRLAISFLPSLEYEIPAIAVFILLMLVILPLTNRLFYRFTRSAVLFRVKEAGIVYFRVDDNHRNEASSFYRDVMLACESHRQESATSV
jgi:hypothetical protein